MSQKDSKFQSKGKKFGGPRKPGGGGFGKKFEGDTGSKGGFKGGSRSFGGKKPFKRDDEGASGGRSFGDRKPFKKRFDDDRPRRSGDDRPRRDFDSDRKPRSFGDTERKPFKKRFDDDRPRRDGDDRPRRSFDRDDRKPRSFGDGERKPFKKRFDDDRPRRSFDDKKPRSFGDRPRRDDDRKPFQKRERMTGTDRAFAAARPHSAEEGAAPERKPFKEKPFRGRDYGASKPYQRSFDNDRPRGKKPFGKPDRRDREENEYQEASSETRQRLNSGRSNLGAPSSAFLYGIHAVSAALSNTRRTMQRLLVTETGMESIQDAYDAAIEAGVKLPQPTFVEKEDIERLLPRDAVHQDVLLDSQPPEEVFLIDIINASDDNTKVIILDQVTDPHNVGAIMRSASAFGAAAVIAQKLNAPEITGTLAKSASGAAEYIPLVRETNLSRAIEQLKDAGFTCLGLDERGKQSIAEFGASGRVALVMGAEGDGLRRLVAENCDALVKLPTSGPIASLNVSNAAAVALYELIRK